MDAAAGVYGNPSSVHAEGQKARRVVEEARDEVARLIEARPEEIVLTSGGTESNALAILGATVGPEGAGRGVRRRAPLGSRGRGAALARIGGLRGRDGRPGALGRPGSGPGARRGREPGPFSCRSWPPTTSTAVSTRSPGSAAELRRRGVLFHTDAVQAAGRLRVDVAGLGRRPALALGPQAPRSEGRRGALREKGRRRSRRTRPEAARNGGCGPEPRTRWRSRASESRPGWPRGGPKSEAPGIAALRDRLEREILGGVDGARVVGSGRAEAAEHLRDPLRGSLRRGPAHPARSRGRRRLGRERLLERHARAFARSPRARALAGGGPERRAVLARTRHDRGGDRARRRDRASRRGRHPARRGVRRAGRDRRAGARVIVECDQCHAKYHYDEDRFAGKPSKKLRCSKCQAIFEVFNTRAYEAGPPVRPPIAPGETMMRRQKGDSASARSVRRRASAGAPRSEAARRPEALARRDRGPDAGKMFAIDKPRVVIGREEVDFALDDPEISRQHAAIEVSGDERLRAGSELHQRHVRGRERRHARRPSRTRTSSRSAARRSC